MRTKRVPKKIMPLLITLLITCHFSHAQTLIDQINVQHQNTMLYMEKIQEYGSQVANLGNEIIRLKAEYDNLSRQLADLEANKDKILREMKLGYYCSQCLRTQSEIEAGGESFQAHLVAVHGVMIPAPPARYKEKSDEFNEQLRQLKAAKVNALVALNKAKLDEADAMAELRRYASLWEGSVNNEDGLKVQEWERRLRELGRKTSQYHDSIFKYQNLVNAESVKPKKDAFRLDEYQRLLHDYTVEYDFSKQEYEAAKSQQEIEKNQWIEFVVNERSDIQHIFAEANVSAPPHHVQYPRRLIRLPKQIPVLYQIPSILSEQLQ